MARCAWCGADNAQDGSFCVKCGKPLPWGEVSGTCGKCGAANATGMTRCGSCGAPLSESLPTPPVAHQPSTGPRCPVCGKEVPPGATMCYECAEGDTEDYQEDYQEEAGYAPRSESLNAAGALLIVAGILTLVQGLMFVSSMSVIDLGFGQLVCCGFLDILFGLGAIAGGLSATKRENFTFLIVGCVLAIVGVGFVLGSILGAVALLMVLAHRDEFD